jgi:two-component system KDP operon response regulator KdpE
VQQRHLLTEVWGPDRADDARSLRVFIKNLRHKLEPDPPRPRYLVTETGLGYRLWVDEVPQAQKTSGESGHTDTERGT